MSADKLAEILFGTNNCSKVSLTNGGHTISNNMH